MLKNNFLQNVVIHNSPDRKVKGKGGNHDSAGEFFLLRAALRLCQAVE
jgi:hypothetical protein